MGVFGDSQEAEGSAAKLKMPAALDFTAPDKNYGKGRKFPRAPSYSGRLSLVSSPARGAA
jgi:hypothetical protein